MAQRALRCLHLPDGEEPSWTVSCNRSLTGSWSSSLAPPVPFQLFCSPSPRCGVVAHAVSSAPPATVSRRRTTTSARRPALDRARRVLNVPWEGALHVRQRADRRPVRQWAHRPSYLSGGSPCPQLRQDRVDQDLGDRACGCLVRVSGALTVLVRGYVPDTWVE